MARTNNLTNFLTDVASAIKEKTGDSTAIPASQFDTKIASIPTGGTYQEKNITITENGNMNLLPDSGYDALSNVRITTNVSGGSTGDATATANDLISPKTAYSQGAKITGTIPLVSSELVYDADGASTYNNSDDPIRQYDLSDYVNHVNARWFIVYGEDGEFYLATNKESLGIYFVCYNLAKDNYDRYIMSGGNIFNIIGTGQIPGNTWSYYVYKLNKSTQRFELYTTASYSTGWSAGTMILIASGGNPIYQRSGDNVDTSKMSYPVTPYVYDPTIVKLGVVADVRNRTKQAIDANAYVKTKIPYDVLTSTEPNAIAANIRLGTTMFGIEGNLAPDKPDQTKSCTPTTSAQTITADTGYELAQVNVAAVTSAIDQNITAGNIKDGVTILGVTGNYSGIDTSDANATTSDILSGKTAYVNGSKITGEYVPLDTSDADATADDIYKDKTAYVNGVKITGRTPNLPISSSNRFKYYYDYKYQRDLTVQQQASNIGITNIDGTIAVTLQTPAIGNFNRFAFSGDNKLKSAVGAYALRGRFNILPENIKTGVTMIDAVGTFSQCTDRGISDVQYKSYWFDGPFVLQSNGYYKFDGTNMAQSNLEIIFNKTTAGDVKLSYKGTNIHKEDTEDPGMYLSETNITVDNSTILTPPEDSSEYIDITITNMSVGEHTILIETYGDSDTVLEIKLLEETPISTTNISKGLTGFVNGNEIKGTYEPDIELDLSSVTYTSNGIGMLLENLYMAGISVTKINHSIDCSSSLPSNLRGVGSMEEYLTLTNTSTMTNISSSMFTGWTSVKRIPLFNTSGVTDWSQSLDQMLTSISQTIEVIPAFDMSGQQNMQSFIYSGYTLSPLNNCSNLSYESINNLMASLLTLPQQPGQIPAMFCTLARLGLDVGYSGNMFDASEIETLSNYPAFTAAGWSIV